MHLDPRMLKSVHEMAKLVPVVICDTGKEPGARQ